MYKSLLLLLLVITLGCSTQKETQNKVLTDCNTTATVKDFTGMDGCKFLLIVENGDKWKVGSKGDLKWRYEDGQKIKFGYREIENMASVCMMEKKMIELTCIELADTDDKPVTPECYRTKKPQTVSWMQDILKKNEVKKVVRYPHSDNFAYLFWTEAKSYVYDCQGYLLCEVKDMDISSCKRSIRGANEGIIIWEALGQND